MCDVKLLCTFYRKILVEYTDSEKVSKKYLEAQKLGLILIISY